MNVRLFRLYGATERQRIAQEITALLGNWSRDWLPTAELCITFRNVAGGRDAALEEIDTEARLLGSMKSDVLIIASTRGRPAGLLQLLPEPGGARGVDPVLERRLSIDVATHCARDLFSCFEQTETVTATDNALPLDTVRYTDGGQPESGKQAEAKEPGLNKPDKKALASVFQSGSGWGVLTLSSGDLQLQVLLGPRYLLQQIGSVFPPKARGGLAEGFSALADKHITVFAELGNTTLTIGDLENLAVGDVIKLDQPYDTPVQLRVANGLHLADGQLGCLAGSKAVKLRPRDTK